MTAKRIAAIEKGKMALQDVDLAPLAPGEVRLCAVASLVSPGTERAFILGLENTPGDYPQYVGYSCAGVVEAVGSDVQGFAVGDRAAGIMLHQSAANVAQEKLVKIPDGLGFDDAAFVRIGVIAMQGVRKARIELGEAAVVIGLGLIGQTALRLARVNGAHPVIGVDTVPSKRALALAAGADLVLDAGDPNWKQAVIEAAGGKGAEVVIESTGAPAPINDAFAVARDFGRVVLLGSTRGNTDVNFYRDVHKKGLSVIGAHISMNPQRESHPGYWTFRDNATAFLNLLNKGRLQVADMVSETRPHAEVEQIYQRVLGWDKDYITTLIRW